MEKRIKKEGVVKIGYLGPEGTFSWKAAKMLAKKYGKNVALVPFPTFGNGLEILKGGEIDKLVFPVENSIDGGIKAVLDILQEIPAKFKIENEMIVPIGQWLLGIKGAKIKDIKTIYSKQEALEQCQRFILENKIEAKFTSSTGEAAQIISHVNSKEQAAIGPKWLTEFYREIRIIGKRVDDNQSNATRFIIFGKNSSEPTRNDKTSIIFTIANKSGSLVKVLDIFAALDINMTKIESRPSKKKIGEYVFYIDISGHKKNKDVKIALRAIRMVTAKLLKVWSYPRHII